MFKTTLKNISLVIAIIFLLFGSYLSLVTPLNLVYAKDLEQELIVHYIDVGQGDSILIQTPFEKSILIDGGPTGAGNDVVQYLRNLGITSIDAIVATHPHEDHIGGLLKIFEEFTVKNVYFTDKTHTTRTYEKFLLAINNSGAKRIRAVAGKTIDIDPNVQITILSPFDEYYSALNLTSVVLKLSYGKTSFLFTGDSELENEERLLEEKTDVAADVLKVAHHGSNTSSSLAFLKEVNPAYAVICVGSGNRYNHPHSLIEDRLNTLGVMVLRTDIYGTIVLQSDGRQITLIN